jgi:hypothetical protein
MFLLHTFGNHGLSKIKKNQGGRMQGLGVDFVKSASLGSLRKVQLEVEKSYDRKSLRAGTRLGLDQLLFNTPILITS